ncbi:MAG: COQ9 family protein [Sphingomonadaceae bacterium]
MASISPAEMTLDELRVELAPRIAANAVFDGWGDRALADAAQTIGIPPERANLAFPKGSIGMIDAWFESIDAEMERRNPATALAGLKIRDRISRLILTRLEIARPQREAVRRALAKLALPGNIGQATRLGWRTADLMWRLAGDAATDFNHYSKRATLAGVYGATLLVWLDDDSEDLETTTAFLSRRIDGIMRFEKTKARLKPDPDRQFSVTRFLGRLRYPDR